MWQMIENDVTSKFPVARCRHTLLRVFVITDGADTLSPPQYRGVAGMDPMMRTLRNAGYEIEFHIIVLGGGVSGRDSNRYRELAAATGGQFLSLPFWDWNARKSKQDRANFIKKVQEYATATAQEAKRLQEVERRKYEARVASGRATKFDWYRQLPAPA